jgi:hypothetical protein
MKWLFVGLLLVHGLIHLMGFAKAFGYAELPQLTMAISRPLGLAWLVAALLFSASSVAVSVGPRGWWVIAGASVVVSQVVIVTSWSDAKFGTLANAIALVGAVYGFASQGPASFRAQFERDVGERLTATAAPRLLTDADVAPLPSALRRYLALNGAVGQPRVRNFHATFSGRIRSGPEAPWMSFVGEQYNFFDPPARLFTMDAQDERPSRGRLPPLRGRRSHDAGQSRFSLSHGRCGRTWFHPGGDRDPLQRHVRVRAGRPGWRQCPLARTGRLTGSRGRSLTPGRPCARC